MPYWRTSKLKADVWEFLRLPSVCSTIWMPPTQRQTENGKCEANGSDSDISDQPKMSSW